MGKEKSVSILRTGHSQFPHLLPWPGLNRAACAGEHSCLLTWQCCGPGSLSAGWRGVPRGRRGREPHGGVGVELPIPCWGLGRVEAPLNTSKQGLGCCHITAGAPGQARRLRRRPRRGQSSLPCTWVCRGPGRAMASWRCSHWGWEKGDQHLPPTLPHGCPMTGEQH